MVDYLIDSLCLACLYVATP